MANRKLRPLWQMPVMALYFYVARPFVEWVEENI